jgi:hypothetical protein
MRCGLFAILSCLAVLSVGCGTETTNRGGMDSGSRTTNKPVIEDRTGDRTPTTTGPGITTDRTPPAGQPALPAPGLTPNPDNSAPPSTTPSTANPNQNTTPPINPTPAPDRQTPPATTP